jgi:hypothetical protein
VEHIRFAPRAKTQPLPVLIARIDDNVKFVTTNDTARNRGVKRTTNFATIQFHRI